MAVPFGIDIVTSAVYAAINARPLSLVPLAAVSVVFLLVGVGIGAWLLIRPIERFLAGEATFAEVEPAITSLPRRSATLVACLYGPLLLICACWRARYGYHLRRHASRSRHGSTRSARSSWRPASTSC